ncbi:MAG: glycosyltransferase [Anaerolineales bacterium]|nr:glycosyltransferase [Anaerolineales bacterium]
MRIALICQAYPPMISGAAIVVHRLAEGLAQRGHHVLVIAASESGQPTALNPSPLIPNLQLTRLRSWPNPFRVGQRAVLFPRAAVQKALRDFAPSVVHAHDPVSVGLAGILAARQLKIPAALTIHQLPWFVAAYLPKFLGGPVERLLWIYARWLNQQVQAAITPSQTIAAIVHAHGAGQPIAISNGVDLERFTPLRNTQHETEALLQKYGLGSALPIILHAGRLDADKRTGLALRAAARAGNAQLLVVGDGTQRRALEKLAAQLQLKARFTGYVRDELPALFRLAQVFITASEVEIQSSVAMEAAASGLPIVAVRASSMAEFVQEGVTGYLVPPRDVNALAARLTEILSTPQLAQNMSHAARQFAETHSTARTLDAHEALYTQLAVNGKQ